MSDLADIVELLLVFRRKNGYRVLLLDKLNILQRGISMKLKLE